MTDSTYSDWKFGNTFIQTPNKFTFYPKDYVNEIVSNERDKAIQLSYFKNQKINVPYLSKSKISLIAEDIYNQYKCNNGKLDVFMLF